MSGSESNRLVNIEELLVQHHKWVYTEEELLYEFRVAMDRLGVHIPFNTLEDVRAFLESLEVTRKMRETSDGSIIVLRKPTEARIEVVAYEQTILS